MQNTLVVVPCYDEARRFRGDAFAAAAAADASLSFVFVNDGSRDGTEDVLRQLTRQNPAQLALLSLGQNQGKAEAVRQGMLHAFERGPDLVAYFDADLATPLGELAAMRACFGRDLRLEIVLGSRVALLGHRVTRSPVRHYLGRVFASAASLALALTVYDTQCGAKVLRNSPGVREVFAHRFASRWTFDVEILARLSALAREGVIAPLEVSALEYPLQAWCDVAGSKLRLTAALSAGLEIGLLRQRYRRGWQR
jgi:glycosyltransferase involved in cell wall biosynthesis